MKNDFSHIKMLACAAVLAGLFPSVHAQQTLIFDGTNIDLLRPDIDGTPDGLFPDGSVGNSVTMSGGTINNIYGAAVLGSSDASNNSVKLTGGTVMFFVYGAQVGTGNVHDNIVTITGGQIDEVVGGNVFLSGNVDNNHVIFMGGQADQVRGGYTNSGIASNNTVFVSGGSIQTIYGGSASGRNGSAINNTVTITGGSVGGNIYGGFGAITTNNTVTLGSGATLAATSSVYGGSRNDNFTGNTLNLKGYRGSVNTIANFQNYNIWIPPSLPSGQALVTVATPVDLTNTNMALEIEPQGRFLPAGTVYVPFSQTTGTPDSISKTVLEGIAIKYDLNVTADAPALTLALSNPRINPQTKSLSEGQVAGAAFVEQGADLIVTQGMRNALTAAQGGEGFNFFSAIGGSSSTLKTGSEVNLHTISMLVGGSKIDGPWLLSGFFEYGTGSYNTSNSFSDAASVYGHGDTEYYGIGVAGQYRFDESGPNGPYLDASLRSGWNKVSYGSNDLCSVDGQCASYDTNSRYFGGHIGAGYLYPINEHAVIDFNSRYLWNRVGGNNAEIVGDTVNFNSITSSRWSNALRMDYHLDNGMVPYVGAGYVYQFDGEANASIYGLKVPAPTLKGGTTVAEAGIRFHENGASFDLALQDFSGQRQGWGGSISYKKQF